MQNPFAGLTRFERGLWLSSLLVVSLSFFLCGAVDYLSLAASLIGCTCLIMYAKGRVFGHILGVAFAVIYAIRSYSFQYYGEMLTYLCMSLPIALASIYTWLKHPAANGEQEVSIVKLPASRILRISLLAVIVTAIFYFILGYFHTARLLVSTLSVTTSFFAAYLSMCRCSWYAVAYMANDIVLIVLWSLAASLDITCLPMVFCFIMFLFNDSYGFYNWRRMYERQNKRHEF